MVVVVLGDVVVVGPTWKEPWTRENGAPVPSVKLNSAEVINCCRAETSTEGTVTETTMDPQLITMFCRLAADMLSCMTRYWIKRSLKV